MHSLLVKKHTKLGYEMWKEWPYIALSMIALWVVVAVITNHGPSGAIFGTAVGATTFRDPLFIVAAVIAAMMVRKWWQALLVAVAIAVLYPIVVGTPIRPISIVGRTFSVIIICSIAAILRSLYQRIR